MNQTLKEIAEELRDNNKKVQLIYAFNGCGKTRLSRKFKDLISPKTSTTQDYESKVLYYNAFTEDLFYWDNDLDADRDRKLLIQPNNFTDLALDFLKDQGLDNNIITNFQHFTDDSITPLFNEEYTKQDEDGKDIVVKAYSEVKFSLASGDNQSLPNIKISKGEESNFVWCVFYSLIEQVVELHTTEDLDERFSDKFNHIKYVFIDDPISSLDENHLIELAVNLASLVKKSRNLNFIISTHNPLFFNVLYNELGLGKKKGTFMLTKNEDGRFSLNPKGGDSNKSFSYHLYLKETIEEAIKTQSVEKYHFMLLRNLYEKTANFLGYQKWSDLLPEDRKLYYNRIIQFTSHSTLSNEVIQEPTNPEKQTIKLLLEHLVNSKYWQEEIAVEPVTEEASTIATENESV